MPSEHSSPSTIRAVEGGSLANQSTARRFFDAVCPYWYAPRPWTFARGHLIRFNLHRQAAFIRAVYDNLSRRIAPMARNSIMLIPFTVTPE